MIKSKGYAALTPKSPLMPWSFERQDVAANDVLIEILYSGVCHTDIHVTRDEWFPGIYPMVPGHEIVGRVTQVGSNVKNFKVGDTAGVGTYIDACHHCEECQSNMEQFCSVSPLLTYSDKNKKTGEIAYGGYANNIVVREDFAYQISEKLDIKRVAPLLCAGITTYSPLKKWGLKKGQKLGVVGLGGLGHMAVKFGLAMGAEVTVLSTSPNKAEAAKKLGAHHFIVTKNEEEMQKALKSFHLIIDTVSADHEVNPYISALKSNGVYVNVGMPTNGLHVGSFNLVVGNKTVTGSGVGGIKETQEMLDFCAEHNIMADVEIIKMKDINLAFERMLKGDVFYRFVIDMKSLED